VKAPLILVVALIFGMILLGIATLHSGLLFLAIPLLTYLFTAIAHRPDNPDVIVVRALSPDFAPQGTPINVKIGVTNQGAAIAELAMQDVLPDGVAKIAGRSGAASFMPLQGKLTLDYTIGAQRGEYNLYELLVDARDYFGFFERSYVYQTAPHLVIAPRYPKLARIKIRPPQTRGFAGPIAARQGGSGLDFWGLREYQTGDRQRQINWKRTARSYQEIYANVFEQERVADVGLILDARQRTNVILPSGSLFEHAVRVTAALAENFLEDGNRVSLLVYGGALIRIFPGYGKVQHERILRALAKAHPELNYALESLTYLPIRFFPPKSQIVLVSPLLPEDISILVRMRAYGYAVLVISPDPNSYEAATHQDFTSAAYRIAYAERIFFLRQLRQYGLRIVNWPVDQPLEVALRDTLARQPPVVTTYRTSP